MKSIFLSLILALCLSANGLAQININFQIANTLYQQQRYEEALSIFKEFAEQDPGTYLYTEKVTDCLIQLKRYDEAIQFLEDYNRRSADTSVSNIKLAEVFHVNGDSADAYTLWNKNLQSNPNNLQVYLNTGRSLVDRKEFDRAIDVYKKGRTTFKNEQLFFLDIANSYLQSGDYENSIQEYLSFIKSNPDQIRLFQRTLLRYKDPFIYDIAILEFEDALADLDVTNPAYNSLHNLLIWMLQENKLFRRAVTTALRYEKTTAQVNYSLFNLGRELVQNNEYELASRAFEYYIESGNEDIRWRSQEELSQVNIRWANYLESFGISFDQKSDSLYQSAFDLLQELVEKVENYSRLDQVYLVQAELALDYLYETDLAISYIHRLKELSYSNLDGEIFYLEGRIELLNGEYNQARLLFTKSNRVVRLGELAEKTRYYLALTDFFEQDFEFAQIQLKTLGRQKTSIYANDALELRLWIQKGKDLGSDLTSAFVSAVKLQNEGQFGLAKDSLFHVVNNDYHPYRDNALLQLATQPDTTDIVEVFNEFSEFMASGTPTPIRERLLWEQAKLAEYLTLEALVDPAEINPAQLYETLILEYPQGFYAAYARKRLSELPTVQS